MVEILSKKFEQKDYEVLRNKALTNLQKYMDSLPIEKGAILAYWVNDYARFLSKEASFDPKKLIRYDRGSIVKVHLGYRIGSEEGGLHYAVVMDIKNDLSSPIATVIPLTSLKAGTDVEHLHPSRVYLGSEIYNTLNSKCVTHLDEVTKEYEGISAEIETLNSMKNDTEAEYSPKKEEELRIKIEEIRSKRKIAKVKLNNCRKMAAEIEKMKQGSIALVGQITTVSKIRIYDPLYPSDVLSNIRLSPGSMDILDAKIRELFTYHKEK